MVPRVTIPFVSFKALSAKEIITACLLQGAANLPLKGVVLVLKVTMFKCQISKRYNCLREFTGFQRCLL